MTAFDPPITGQRSRIKRGHPVAGALKPADVGPVPRELARRRPQDPGARPLAAPRQAGRWATSLMDREGARVGTDERGDVLEDLRLRFLEGLLVHGAHALALRGIDRDNGFTGHDNGEVIEGPDEGRCAPGLL